jgi:alkylation response protein AidB-like acyl-CoA dehydrogenase
VDVRYPPEAERFREKVRAFLAEKLPEGWRGVGALSAEEGYRFVAQWREVLHEAGYLAVSWPVEFGGSDLSPLEQVILMEEFTRAGVPSGGPNDVFSIQMIGNTLLVHGTDEQKRYFLPRILSGEHVWCQGYSEPNAGSDLGGVTTRAVLDGDEWVIDGQKIWTSYGHLANWIFVVARTDFEAPKHRGLSFLLVPMDQPGVEVRPIRMISGDSEFNEVFFTGARTARSNIVGKVNEGWTVAMTLLGFERGEAAATFPIRFREELDKLIELARLSGESNNPVIRQRLAQCFVEVEVMRFLGLRSLTRYLAGALPGPESSIFKLYWSEYHKRATELAMSICGASALAPGRKVGPVTFPTDYSGSPNDVANWYDVFLKARAGTIYAGTSQVQRNIIGERVLGLPKELA